LIQKTIPPVIVPEPPQVTYHTVMPKETLWRISKTYNVPLQTLMDANQIVDVTKISIGQTLVIPGAPAYRPPVPLFKNTGRWKYIVIHHTASDYGDAETINRWHLKRGWRNGLGYHFVIDNGTLGHQMGQIEPGRRWYKQMRGAHVGVRGWNDKSIGIALVGNFSKTEVPEEMFDSLVYLTDALRSYYGISKSRIVGHRDVRGAKTECPGKYFPWNRFINSLN